MTGRRGLIARLAGGEPMGAGALLSAGLHGGLLGLALFGLDVFGTPPPEPMVFENVSLISAPEFDAAMSKAPDAPMLETAALAAPSFASDAAPDAATGDLAPLASDEFIYGDVAAPEAFPDLSAVLTPLARANVRPPLAPTLVAPGLAGASRAPTTLGASAAAMAAPPGAPRMDEMRRSEAPRLDTAPPPPADRVAPEAQPRPDTPSRADRKVAASVPDPDAPPAPAKELETKAAAPEEAAERLVTEAERPDPDLAADLDADLSPAAPPMTSAIPVGRPAALRTAAAAPEAAPEAPATPVAEAPAKPEPAPKPEPELAPKPEPKTEIAAKPAPKPEPATKPKPAPKPAPAAATKTADAAGTAAASAGADAPVGQPLTSGEVSGIKGTISKFWNKGMLERTKGYEDLVVTMRITLDMQGKMVGQPEMISPTGAAAADPRFKQAGAIAARALQRAAPYDLPPGKFARWRTIEVTFNPGLGVSM